MTKEIELTQGYKAIVDDDKYDYLMQWKWCVRKGKRTPYAHSRMGGKSVITMHKALMPCEKGMEIDHINGNGLDNRLSNLRICTHAQNRMNGHCDNTSGYKGVYPRPRGGWYAAIRIDKRLMRLGNFENPEDAARVYDEKAKKVQGEYAWLNFRS